MERLLFNGKLLSACGLAAWMLALAAAPALADEHAHHHHNHKHLTEKDIDMPPDYGAAVVRIKECLTTIAEEYTAGHLDELHAPLDESSIIAGKLMNLARDSGVPKAQWTEINLASKDLKKQLSGMHGALDAHRKIDFKATSSAIAKAMARLEQVATAPSDAVQR